MAMLVRKRNGRSETYNAHKFAKRLEMTLCGVDPRHVDIGRRSILTAPKELAIQSALRAAPLSPAYVWMAGHLEVSKMHKTLYSRFSDSVKAIEAGRGEYLLRRDFLDSVIRHQRELNSAIVHFRDYEHSYYTVRHIQRRCLARDGDTVLERIQHMIMRSAVAVHQQDLESVLAMYELLSTRQLTYDVFLYRNAGFADAPLSSISTMALFAVTVKEVYDAIAKCAFAARNGGRIALSAIAIPCCGRRTDDRRTNLANVAIEPWHIDTRSVLEFLNMHQDGLCDQRSMTISLIIPDLFMVRLEEDGPWTMFCPTDVPDLINLQGNEFDDAYVRYEKSGSARARMPARDLWDMILRSNLQAGGPSIIFKDNVNRKTNLPHLGPSFHADAGSGMIDTFAARQFLSERHHASIALPLMVTAASTFDFGKLRNITREITITLNKVLDMKCTADADDRNADFRAVAIGMYGLADVFAALRLPYASPEAASLSRRISETLYYAALEASCELAEHQGAYKEFSNSPLAEGTFQFDLWDTRASTYFDWDDLRSRIRRYGVRNAAMIAIAAGSSADTVTGYTESTDPISSNLDGNTVCPWLVKELDGLGLWTETMRDDILKAEGSVQRIDGLPEDVKEVYLTAWEIDPEAILRMALQRAPFVCHSQALTWYLYEPTVDSLGELLVRAWASGLKTGAHTVRGRTASRTPSSHQNNTDSDGDGQMSFEDVVASP
ncbi:hypothetical protein DFH06DRAFT_1127581 [Mycena polygramma]|nr:hypothetical protein DFH06DRAFT_1127581 [Mycena polygramma]